MEVVITDMDYEVDYYEGKSRKILVLGSGGQVGAYLTEYLRCVDVEVMEFDIVKFPSAFSKSIGFTLCGIVDEPTSPATVNCFKYPFEIYNQQSFDRSRRTLLRFSIIEIIVTISSFNSI